MKRTEFETKLVALDADFAKERLSVETLINDIYAEMDDYEKKMIECKGRIRNLRNNLEKIKTVYLDNKSMLFVEFEKSNKKNESDW